MQNPIGPYPGRQLFTGLTIEGNPCLVYLVTGRSPESRERKAVQMGDKVAIGPLGVASYDPLRHYTAVMHEKSTGVAAVSNGIQTEAIFETYRLLHNVKTQPTQDYLQAIMEGAAAEPDNLHTPRIGAIVTSRDGKPVSFVSIKRHDRPATAFEVRMQKGRVTGIAVYNGSMETPGPFDPTPGLPELEVKAAQAKDIATFLFEISAAANKGQDIRVCTVGAVLISGGWDLAIVNAH
jgi:IMP cyclohydrolase